MPRGAMLEADPELSRMMSPEQREAARRISRERKRDEKMQAPTVPEGSAEYQHHLSAETERERFRSIIANFDREFGTGPGAGVRKQDLTRAKFGRGGRTAGSSSIEHRGTSV